MTNKLIPYDIVYCSSEDESHRIDQLVGHSYQSISLEEGTPGWQSSKGADFPQVLILRFPGNAWLHQLRLLSHEVKIASRVEVRLYKLSEDELRAPPSFEDVRFSKLGYVQFSNNEQSHYESKERKTIHLKAEGYFMKLLFYEPYKNPMNRAEQVGLYAIECLGRMRQRVSVHTDPHLSTYGVMDLPQDDEDSRLNPNAGSHTPNTAEYSLHTTPFNSAPRRRGQQEQDSRLLPPLQSARAPFRSVPITQFDTFFVQRAEELLSLRESARSVDDVDMVELCTEKMQTLNAIAVEMYTLEQEKVAAIVDENFAEAKRLKEAMEKVLQVAVQETQLPGGEGPAPGTNLLQDHDHAQAQSRAAPARGDVSLTDIPSPPSVRNSRSGSLPSFNRRRSTSSEVSTAAAVVDSMRPEDIPDPDERAVANFIFDVAGEEERDFVFPPNVGFETRRLVSTVGSFITACLLSRRFKLREAALVAITERMSDTYANNAALVEDAVLRFLDYSNYGLQDSFPNVVLASCIYIRLCIGDEFQCIENVVTPLSQLVPRLMTRAADPTPRIRDEALGTLEQMVLHSALPSSIFMHAVLADPLDKEKAKVPPIKPRPQLARLFLLQMMLQENRLGATPASNKMLYPTVLLPCINHANSEVRDIAVGIIQTLLHESLITLKKTDVIKIRSAPLRDAVKNTLNDSGNDSCVVSPRQEQQHNEMMQKQQAGSLRRVRCCALQRTSNNRAGIRGVWLWPPRSPALEWETESNRLLFTFLFLFFSLVEGCRLFV
eukprot:gene4152-2994_t